MALNAPSNHMGVLGALAPVAPLALFGFNGKPL